MFLEKLEAFAINMDRSIVLHFPSCVCILQNNFFHQVFEMESCQWVGEFWVGGWVGRWVSAQWSVGRWSVGRWSVDLIKPLCFVDILYICIFIKYSLGFTNLYPL